MLEVRASDHNGKEGWGLYLGGYLIGTSKSRSDADFARQILIRWASNYPVSVQGEK